MNRIDYIHPTAVEQIQKAMHSETVPSNDGNRDGMVNDVRYFSDFALSQIRGVDLGPEFDMAEASRYKAVFLTLAVDETFDSQDPTTWKFMVEHVTSLAGHSDNWITCELDTTRVTTLIGTSHYMGNQNLSQVICAILKDCPEEMIPDEDDTIPYSDMVAYRQYQANDRIFNTPFEVQLNLPGAGWSGTASYGLLNQPAWGLDTPIIFMGIFANYLYAQTAASSGSVPNTITTTVYIGPFTFEVKFPFFTIPTQA